MKKESANADFVLTRWSLVLRARGKTAEAQAALSELCEAYYQPVLRFLMREGRKEDAARELGQEFFARVLARGGFATVDPARGRFRSYLLGALKHFLADERDREHRLKRGGSVPLGSLTAATDTTAGIDVSDPAGRPPEAWFDRAWALAVVERAMSQLETEYLQSGKREHFAVLNSWLVGESPRLCLAKTAAGLGLSEGAAKVAVHRLRRRFRELVKAEISQTVPGPDDIADEFRHLIAALSG
jgi:RNA polymerase sigma-70 factor (ECF subfamily)